MNTPPPSPLPPPSCSHPSSGFLGRSWFLFSKSLVMVQGQEETHISRKQWWWVTYDPIQPREVRGFGPAAFFPCALWVALRTMRLSVLSGNLLCWVSPRLVFGPCHQEFFTLEQAIAGWPANCPGAALGRESQPGLVFSILAQALAGKGNRMAGRALEGWTSGLAICMILGMVFSLCELQLSFFVSKM